MTSPIASMLAFSASSFAMSKATMMAQAAAGDNNLVSSLVSWGSSGAVIFVTVYFLKFLADDNARRDNAISKLSDDNIKAQEQLRAAIEKMGDRFDHSQQIFQEQFQRISEDQTKILQQTISVVGALQGTVSEMKRSIGEMHVMLVKFLPGPEVQIKSNPAIESPRSQP